MAQKTFSLSNEFAWIDLVNPTADEIQALAEKYNLHSISIKDSMDPRHLPKYEQIDDVIFIVTRVYDQDAPADADSAQELSRKLSFFIGKNFLITIHRKELPELLEVQQRLQVPNKRTVKNQEHLLCILFKSVANSYASVVENISNQVSELEENAFKSKPDMKTLEETYYLKRKVATIKRLIRMTNDSVMRIPFQPKSRPYFQDVKESAEAVQFSAEESSESLNNLLQMYLSLQGYRTNEVVQTLTVISVIIMPLNLIVGIYGMNFSYMPELQEKWGYFVVLGFLAALGISIYIYFRRRSWI